MSDRVGIRPVPEEHTNEAVHRRTLARTLNAILRGEGLPTRWDDVRIPLETTTLGGANDPTFGQVRDDGAGSTGVFARKFAFNVSQEVFFSVQLPHEYAEETDLRPHVHWMPITSGTGLVAFGLEFTRANVNGTFGTTETLVGTATALGSPAIYQHTICPLGTISGTGMEISNMLICRLYRVVAGFSGAALSATVAVLEVDFHIEKDARGSWAPFNKWAR